MTGTSLVPLVIDQGEGFAVRWLLTHSDRCDKCGARAYVHIILANGDDDLYTIITRGDGHLYFCRHDWLAIEKTLRPKCMYINDETRQLFDGIRDDHWVEGQKATPPSQRNKP